jgi:hypothetical protein
LAAATLTRNIPRDFNACPDQLNSSQVEPALSDLALSSDPLQKAPRLYVDASLSRGSELHLDKDQTNYLINVMRLGDQDGVKIFNGIDGEWLALISGGSKKSTRLILQAQIRHQTKGPDLHYLFAPLKHARLDYMMQKATEMGASHLVPVMTRRGSIWSVCAPMPSKLPNNAAFSLCPVLASPSGWISSSTHGQMIA